MKKVNDIYELSSHWDMNVLLKGCSPDHSDQWAKLDVTSVPHSAFLQAMEVIAKSNKESLFTVNHSNDMLNNDSNITPTHQKEADTMTISREELDAKLAQNKAEVQAIASGMREEMAKWREEQNTQMSQLNATLSTISSKIDSKFDAVDGKIDGLKTSLTTTQWSMTIGIALVTIILSTVMIYSSSIIASAEKADTKQPQPTVIYVQQPNLAEPPQPTNESK